MSSFDLVEHVKLIVGYTEKEVTCSSCVYCELDRSTDNFGVGDQCKRNPDIQFRVNGDRGRCHKHTPKGKSDGKN